MASIGALENALSVRTRRTSVLFNLNVTEAGDPLANLRSADGAVAGISDEGKNALYGALAVSGVVLGSVAMLLASLIRDHSRVRRTATGSLTTFGLLALAGVAGLALDYRDGPVRTVQFVVYFATVLAVVRAARLGIAVASYARPSAKDEEPARS
jgi:hypothetical protein